MNDLKFVFRQLLKNPGFAAVVELTLALGIGANTALLSIINAVSLRPLPYPEPDRLVAVGESNPRLGWDHHVTSLGAFSDWREQSSTFQELAGATVRASVQALRVNNNVGGSTYDCVFGKIDRLVGHSGYDTNDACQRI